MVYGKLLLFFVVSKLLFIDVSSLNGVPEAIRKYNYYVNMAELSIVESQYEQAVLYYDSAFMKKDYAFAVDKYNAAICHIYLKQYAHAYSFFQEILQKGYAVENLKSKAQFKGFFESSWGQKLINYSDDIEFTLNSEVRSILDSLLFMDQLFRKNREFGNPYDFFEDTINRIDDSNRIVLKNIIDEYGFPGEEIIGLSDTSLTRQPYQIILLHFQQISSARRRGEFRNVIPWIQNAYNNGRMPAHEAAFLLEASGMDYGNSFSSLVKYRYVGPDPYCVESDIVTKETPWGFFNLTEEERNEINSVRSEFGLESVEDLRKKLVFKMNTKIFDFSKIYGGRSIYQMQDYEWYKNVNLIFVE
jgi:hypothetical protein